MKRCTILYLLLFLIIGITNLYAQTGSIKGKVIGSDDGKPLPFANVVIIGTTNGAATDQDGNYIIRNIQPGTKKIGFSYLGYVSITIEAEIIADRTLELEDVKLDHVSIEGEEVLITAQAQGQLDAINQQVNSNTMKNVVARDRLQENPDANAVEAIGRIPGVSVIRSGGEGSGIVIRGLEPKYTTITLNGIPLPASSGNDRGSNISSISQYALQGVEILKSLTPDMEANSVAGTINLKLKEAPEGFRSNILVQSGYNNLNSYLGNYKFQADVSNRFFDDKLGVFFTGNAERVNRSTQTVSAGYGVESTTIDDNILLNNAKLNDVFTLKYRQTATLSLDYLLSDNSKLFFYGLYTRSNNDHNRVTKEYDITGAGGVKYNMHLNPDRLNEIFQTALSGETVTEFFNLELDYGVAYSQSQTRDPNSRSWNYDVLNSSPSGIGSSENRGLDPSEVVPLFTDDENVLNNMSLTRVGYSTSGVKDRNLSGYLNFKIPLKIDNTIDGYLKFGGIYRIKDRLKNNENFYQSVNVNNEFTVRLIDDVPWTVFNNAGEVSGLGLDDGQVEDFLNGKYNFGYTFNFERLNEITDWWTALSNKHIAAGDWAPIFSERNKVGYQRSVEGGVMNDQDILEYYRAGYIMSELNFGKMIMFMPGVRYESTNSFMNGWDGLRPTREPSQGDKMPGSPTFASRNDEFFLPMIHARINPSDNWHAHLSYTQTLSRPDFNAISPNVFVNNGILPFRYIATNPNLKPEFWTNYDIQVAAYSNEIGLFSINGFYKEVSDKIWSRSYTRIRGDKLLPGFAENSVVNVTEWENHQNTVTLQGIEFEWQTNFWYLPNPFNYFTLNLNYTYTHSETKYPYTRITTAVPPGGGRPVQIRIDSTSTGPMLYQPVHIVNANLGFNYKGFNAWFSFQYNGEIFTSKNFLVDELDALKQSFYRWDFQVTQVLPIQGLTFIANIANISDFTEIAKLRGDPRATLLENYGWTADFGFRLNFN